MLTIAQLPTDITPNNPNVEAFDETLPTDAEISRRVLRIRAGWTVQERVERRRDADQRFSDLLIALVGEAA